MGNSFRRRTVTAAIGFMAAVVAASVTLAANGGRHTGTAAADGEFIDIDIVDFAFEPATVTMDTSDAIVWTHRGGESTQHTVTADDGRFDSGPLDALGIGFDLQFETPGTYTYHCEIHPEMKGTIVVR
ncbi:hypothetical protein AYO38_06725, partial [bacterium SCGC AG-212-C10]